MKNTVKKFDLRKNYPVIFEIALIAALLLIIGAIKIHVPAPQDSAILLNINDEPPIVLPPVTRHEKIPAPPAFARIPAPVPDDSPIETPPIDFGNIDDPVNPLALPPDTAFKNDDEVLEFAEFMPELRGGIEALYNDITYPENAKRVGIEGMVVVQFIINEKGEVTNPQIIRGIGGGCDEEVLRAIKKQRYTPGIQNGTLVKVRVRQVIHFRLQN
ncbi:MAG: TonB family protein [Gracilimonas sp.]